MLLTGVLDLLPIFPLKLQLATPQLAPICPLAAPVKSQVSRPGG